MKPVPITQNNWDQTESVPGLADLDQPGQGSLPEGRLCYIGKVLNTCPMWV